MKTEKNFSNGTPINELNAVAVAEGWEESPLNDALTAWAYLIRTGLCWQLQGYFGRHAAYFIENGIITPEGDIDWNVVDELI